MASCCARHKCSKGVTCQAAHGQLNYCYCSAAAGHGQCFEAGAPERYVGILERTMPIVMIRDPELIKLITVKDFDHFVDHREFFGEDVFNKVTEEVDVDDLMRRYANDVIASTAFGIEVNSVVDKTNEFYETGQKLSNFSVWMRIKILITHAFPALAKKLKLQAFSEKTTNFFRGLVKNTMEYREQNKVERPDMIQLLMQAAKEWNPDELVGQAFIFFMAGFETSASVLVMTVHELSLNPEVQATLYEEIKQFGDVKKALIYDILQNMKYLDMVINETFRKWSPAIIMDRVCLKPYDLPPSRPGANPYTVEPGQVVYNMVNCIHMDEKYYPEPHRFDPERFSEENKNNIKPFTFMPFGMGPRNCIGARFALLEVKVLLYHLILNFEILKCQRTSEPLRLQPTDFQIKALGGTWVKLRKRY
ncbi:Probable cytochrome P450 9f2 [Eumeta japonica]|uniref:unspecific monooxygenase n=1 Tax=Eumeta variegata TaxID=151549 RepID=A0A4C1YSB6_EUMVA|nr:Probable cytochrome P450 9f2 [Eumeta japonica]